LRGAREGGQARESDKASKELNRVKKLTEMATGALKSSWESRLHSCPGLNSCPEKDPRSPKLSTLMTFRICASRI
jgi:hypothetical protein